MSLADRLEPPAGVIVRRDFLRLAGTGTAMLGMGTLLGACGSHVAKPAGAAGASTAAGTTVGGPLSLFTWQGYDLTKPFTAWRQENHIRQSVKYINTQFDVATILRGPGGHAYDASSANQGYTKLFQSLGIMQEITAKDVPSLPKMFSFFRDSPIWKWSPGGSTYNSVPWTWGAVGISYQKRLPQPQSWRVLIDPRNRGRVGTVDDPFNNISIAAIALGIPLTQITRQQLNGPIRAWLLKLKRNLKSISPNLGDQQTLLANGEIDYMSVGLTLFNGNSVGFAVPREGGFGFCDAAFVTPFAPDKANAFAFCEALLGGRTAAEAANNLNQAVAVPSVVSMLKPAVKQLYPYHDLENYLSSKLKFEVNYAPAKGQNVVSFDDINRVWADIKSA